MAEVGTIENPDLVKLTELLDKSLEKYQKHIGNNIKFGSHLPLYMTPEKPNSGRTVVEVNYEGSKAGDMCVILFRPGDGTGDDKTYKLHDLEIPEYLRFIDKPERVLPRKKTCAMEVFFPFFSVIQLPYGDEIPTLAFGNVVSLEELTVDAASKKIVKMRDLGESPETYRNKIGQVTPHISLTTGYLANGTRFGDPHSIFHRQDVKSMQVVGFLSLGEDDPICEAFLNSDIMNEMSK